MDTQLLKAARQVIMECDCEDGCPSCVGPYEEVGHKSKIYALKIIKGCFPIESFGKVKDLYLTETGQNKI